MTAAREENQVRTAEVANLLEQQNATSAILRVIAASPTNIQPVLQTLVDSAIRLAGADMGAITLRVGDTLRFMAGGGQAAELHAYERANPHVVGRATFQGRAALEGLTIHVADALEDPEYERPEAAIIGSFRGVLSVPLKRGQETIGVFGLARRTIGLFSPRQVELVESFADQAVIAIENARLIEKVEGHNRELAESLDQQTATAEVLKTISSSVFDLNSVLHTLVKSASDLCHSGMGYIYLRQGDVLQPTVQIGWSQEFQDHMNKLPVTPGRGSIAARVAQSGSVEQIADVLDDPEYTNIEGQRLGGFRTLLGVPLMRDGAVTGVFVLARSSVSPFSTREIELVQTFSDQAVIAIENVRLFEEVGSRGRELADALEKQTATGAILQVIAGSPTDIQPVLDAVAESAARLCDAYDATIYLLRSDRLVVGAHHGPIPIDSAGLPVARDIVTGRAVLDRVAVHVHDLTISGEEFATGRMMAQRLGFRAILATPLLQEGKAIGALMIRRIEARPFSDSQIGLLKTFANQAVIAIGNVRLFGELQARTAELGEALQQQTATADVLKVISRSAFDLQSVLQTLIDSAVRLCGAKTSGIFMREGDVFRLAAGYDQTPEYRAYEEANPSPINRQSWVGRTALDKAVVHIPDVTKDTEHGLPEAPRLGGYSAVLCVPLMREGSVIGVFAMTRPEPGPFTDSQIELVQTFADQAVIAIENVRLFQEVQARTAELSESLQQQTATADVLKAISRSTFDLQAVLDTLTQSAAQLCEADMAGITRQGAEGFYYATNYNLSSDWQEYVKDKRLAPGRGTVVGRALLDRKIVHVADVLADPEYTFLESTSKVWFRTVLGVPLMREGNPIGVLVLARQEVQPFTEKQIDLIQTFADQAVIAIENARLFEEVEARTAELSESLQQQTATADVLKVISRSAFNLGAVLDTLIASACRLCNAEMGLIFLSRDGSFSPEASHGTPPGYLEFMRTHPIKPGRETFTGRAALTKAVVNVDDALNDKEFTFSEARDRAGYRAMLAVPLLRQGEVIGVFAMPRRTPGAFSEKQVELVQTFADQAVIAIENVRLFEEVQQRTREATEALEYQTATSDVLSVISRSPTDGQPVFNMIAQSAARLCEAQFCFVYRFDGELLHFVAHHGITEESVEIVRNTFPVAPTRGSAAERAILYLDVAQIPDLTLDSEFTHRAAAAFSGLRSAVAVPMLRDGLAIGCIAVGRAETGFLASKQVELLKTFADQAVIAIENVRLFDEVKARTAELSELLQQQTATADVLKVISRSAFDLQNVLDTLAESAAHLCDADIADFYRLVDDGFQWTTTFSRDPEAAPAHTKIMRRPGRESVSGRVLLEQKTVHVPDFEADPEFTFTDVARQRGVRCILGVPLLRGTELMGLLLVMRKAPGPFSPKQIELVETFADQAVIAIENARLFEEVQTRTAELSESLQQQTATADVLKAISRSTFDLQPVLDTLVESAAKLCDADTSVIFKRDGDLYRWSAEYGNLPEAAVFAKANPFAPSRDSITGRVALEARAVHVSDVLADPDYGATQLQKLGGYRTILCVPILREGAPVGVFALTRSQVRDFTPRQIELVETFADQSGIAIENVRLFDEVQARTRELSRSLEDLRTAQDRLVQTEKLASLGQLTAGIAHEIKNPLNFVNNFSALSGELIDDLSSVLAGAPLEASVREEVAELTGMLKSNLDKVVQHGKRADSIVRNMLLHSRAGSGDHRPIDINACVEESLNLAYHGARAEKPGFNITLTRNFDPQAGDVDLYPQEITRVLLNLISNGFYATAKQSAATNGTGYEPTLSAMTRSLGDRVEIRIRDNGIGIPPEVKEKMFNPFFTTKPAGEGTGLGLSLSHDIVVKQHAGTIDVDSQPGEFTEFRIVLPRAAASLAKSGGEA
ncbi:GAF domain-containing protein [Mesorhizobium sp. M0676]|uniref:GAF domain-containing protein n=1 Tax=Mesorhizobium sp. M0676 TaxID=2956984 RepID=UPI00333D6570